MEINDILWAQRFAAPTYCSRTSSSHKATCANMSSLNFRNFVQTSPTYKTGDAMKQQIQKALSQVTSTLKETITDLGDSAKEKTISLIESWLEVFPILESMGLTITNFGITLALSPAMEVELSGPPGLFDEGMLDQYKEQYDGDVRVKTVLRAIDSAKLMYQKLGKKEQDEIFLKIRVKIPPEVSVYFGRPEIP
jgi:hypothetical protein